MKRYLTYEEAISLLPNSDYVHTFYNLAFGLCGADWNKTEIFEKLKESEIIELTGETARSMGHGMCAYNKGKGLSEVLFIETDNEKLLAFDKGE
jgi:hypothetical protein